MVIVVKVGGRVLSRNLSGVLDDVAELSASRRVILVHGGGDEVTELSRRLGIEPKFVVSPEGIRSRFTDEKELEVYVMTMAGKVNKAIVLELLKRNVKAVGISGADGPTLIGERKKRIVVVDERGRKRIIDGGFTGRIVRVETELVNRLMDAGFVVVMAPIALDPAEGTLLNVDGDSAAYSIAVALKAEAFVILTDVDGVLIDGKPLERIRCSEAEKLLPKIGSGMNRKVMLASRAACEGVRNVVIGNGLTEKPVLRALSGAGTAFEAR